MQQFKTESKRILDLMINSIYTNREIFLRELISNASDALDKLHFVSLTDSAASRDFEIELIVDKPTRSLTVKDNGIGMTREELENNLGTIAASGTGKFKEENKLDEQMIGQFGVGFYSAFMVADKVTVVTSPYGGDKTYTWVSTGPEGYEITEAPSDGGQSGTAVVLHLKEDTDDFRPGDFLSEYKLRETVVKYSDYIRYPIKTLVTKSKKEEGSDKYVSYTELETLNSMVPLWARPKAKVKKKEYEDFYKQKFNDYSDPAYIIKADIEGGVNYKALLFVPAHAPYDYYTKEYKRGLKLYSAGVLIMDSCADLLPDYFGFIKGVVDSPDLSLNISREVLQQDRQLKVIAESLEKKIVSEFKKFLKNDREGYEKMFGEYGASVKFGIYDKFGAKKEQLKDIVLFYSSYEKKLCLLSEYVSRMKEGQEFIYYACGEDVARIDRLPTTEAVKAKGYEVLYLADSIDEFVLKTLSEYDGKKFRSVSAKDGVVKSEEETEREKTAAEENKSVTEAVKKALGDKVSDVRLNVGLKNHAVCLVAGGEISFEMERVFNAMPGNRGGGLHAEKVLELNPDHAVFARLKAAAGTPQFDEMSEVLYEEAMLIEGFKLDDPAGFVEKINKLVGGV